MTAEELKKLIRTDEWVFTFRQRNEHRLLMADLWARALYTTHAQELRLPSNPQDSLFLTNSTSYMKKVQREQVLQAVRNAVEKDDAYLQYVASTTQQRAEEFAGYVQRLARRVAGSSVFSRRGLAEAWREFDSQMLRLIPWFYIPWYITEENLVAERVRRGLERHRQDIARMTDPHQALFVLATPTRRMMFQDERRDFHELVSVAQQQKRFERDAVFRECAAAYLSNWAWMTTFMFLPLEPLSYDGLIKRIRDSLQQDAPADYKRQEQKRLDNASLAQCIRCPSRR